MNCTEANQIEIVDYLDSLGYQPKKIKNRDYWYLSPLRSEKDPSFKVNRKFNVWFDFGIGRGGNLTDFGILYHNCDVKKFLSKIENLISFHPQKRTVQQPLAESQSQQKALEHMIKVLAAKPLEHPLLCRYLDVRKIPLEIAYKYCRQVDFEMHNKKYFAIGFKNNSGGYELRNEYFKGSSSPKDVTQIRVSGAKGIAVFEGFFSFLSYLAINQKKNHPLPNFLVLNSLSFFERSRYLMKEHNKVNLYLDRDNAGRKHTQIALKWEIKYIDKSNLYKNYKDLNEYLINKNIQQKSKLNLGRHF